MQTNRIAAVRPTFPRFSLRRVLAWLVAVDQRHREGVKLSRLSDEHLADMGFPRKQGGVTRL